MSHAPNAPNAVGYFTQETDSSSSLVMMTSWTKSFLNQCLSTLSPLMYSPDSTALAIACSMQFAADGLSIAA